MTTPIAQGPCGLPGSTALDILDCLQDRPVADGKAVPEKSVRTWKTCKTHGDDKPGAWGCPECLRELREENAMLRRSCDDARRALLGGKQDTALALLNDIANRAMTPNV